MCCVVAKISNGLYSALNHARPWICCFIRFSSCRLRDVIRSTHFVPRLDVTRCNFHLTRQIRRCSQPIFRDPINMRPPQALSKNTTAMSDHFADDLFKQARIRRRVFMGVLHPWTDSVAAGSTRPEGSGDSSDAAKRDPAETNMTTLQANNYARTAWFVFSLHC